MTFKRRTKKLVSELLAVVTVITTAFVPMVTYAAEGEVKDTAIPYYKEVKDQLDADEVVVAKDIEITVGSDFNVKTDFSGIEISASL